MKVFIHETVRKEVEIELPYFYKVVFDDATFYGAVYVEYTYTIRIAERRNLINPREISVGVNPTSISMVSRYFADRYKSNRAEFLEARANAPFAPDLANASRL